MRPVARHIISSLFILLGFIPVIFILIFSIKQQSIRKEMKEKMEREQLHTIVLADSEIQWAKTGKEIWIDGKMFDIKSSESKNGFTIFNGLFDNEETLLKQNLSKDWEKRNTKQNQLFAKIFQSLQNIFFIYTHDIFANESKHLYADTFLSSAILTQFLKIPTPPPLA